MRRWIRLPALKPLALLAAALLIAAGVHWLLPADAAREPAGSANSAHTGAQTGQAAGQPAQQKRAGPVLATAASARDFPIIIRGLGSVQAFNTVTVKSRVDGQITQVAFQEGQHVKAGDVLMQIDPRPYQAQLAQATANKAKDEANLANAQRDLARLAALLQTQLAATRQQYDTQKALVDQLTAAVQADQAQIDAVKLNVEYATGRRAIEGGQ